jgi:hypothetical protein
VWSQMGMFEIEVDVVVGRSTVSQLLAGRPDSDKFEFELPPLQSREKVPNDHNAHAQRR